MKRTPSYVTSNASYMWLIGKGIITKEEAIAADKEKRDYYYKLYSELRKYPEAIKWVKNGSLSQQEFLSMPLNILENNVSKTIRKLYNDGLLTRKQAKYLTHDQRHYFEKVPHARELFEKKLISLKEAGLVIKQINGMFPAKKNEHLTFKVITVHNKSELLTSHAAGLGLLIHDEIGKGILAGHITKSQLKKATSKQEIDIYYKKLIDESKYINKLIEKKILTDKEIESFGALEYMKLHNPRVCDLIIYHGLNVHETIKSDGNYIKKITSDFFYYAVSLNLLPLYKAKKILEPKQKMTRLNKFFANITQRKTSDNSTICNAALEAIIYFDGYKLLSYIISYAPNKSVLDNLFSRVHKSSRINNKYKVLDILIQYGANGEENNHGQAIKRFISHTLSMYYKSTTRRDKNGLKNDLKWALTHHADINFPFMPGPAFDHQTPIEYVASQNCADIFHFLLENNAKLVFINQYRNIENSVVDIIITRLKEYYDNGVRVNENKDEFTDKKYTELLSMAKQIESHIKILKNGTKSNYTSPEIDYLKEKCEEINQLRLRKNTATGKKWFRMFFDYSDRDVQKTLLSGNEKNPNIFRYEQRYPQAR